MIMRNAVVLALGLIVAGCGQAPEKGSGAAPSAPAGQTISHFPKLRPGLWRSVSTTGGVRDEPETNCVGPDEDLIEQFGADDAAQCEKREIRRVGNRIVFDTACAGEYGTITLAGEISGDFQTRMDGDLTLGIGAPGRPVETSRVTIASRYVGTCTPESDG